MPNFPSPILNYRAKEFRALVKMFYKIKLLWRNTRHHKANSRCQRSGRDYFSALNVFRYVRMEGRWRGRGTDSGGFICLDGLRHSRRSLFIYTL